MLHVAVVGSGPSGSTPPRPWSSRTSEVRVDVLDRLPCPYGLVRYGVAPDHEKIKSLQNNLRTVLEHERVRFLGGVEIGPGGRDRRPAAGAVPRGRVLRGRRGRPAARRARARTCRGAGRRPSSCPGTAPIRTPSDDGFVRDARSAVVIGVGNVAVDVARMLARGAGRAARHRHAAGGARPPWRTAGCTRSTWWAGAAPRRPGSPPRSCASWAPCRTPKSSWTRRSWRSIRPTPTRRRCPPRSAATSRCCAAGPGARRRAAPRRIRLRFFLRPVELLAERRPGGRGALRADGRRTARAA